MARVKIFKTSAKTCSPFSWGHPSVPAERRERIPRADETPAVDVESSLRQSFLEGRAEGEKLARQAMEGELKKAQAEFAAAIASLGETRKQAYRQAERDLLRLSVAIARRVLNRELQVSPDALAGIVSSALRRLEGQSVSEIHVHPSMREMVEQHLARGGGNAAVRVVADASLGRGGCVVTLSRGTVDAGIETQLEEIENGLADHLEDTYDPAA